MLCIGVACVMPVNNYRDTLQEKRASVMTIMKTKGFNLRDPEVRAAHRKAKMTLWLPDMDRLLVSLTGRPRKISAEDLVGNPEEGSYIEYIQRHDVPFDERDALEWQSRSMRTQHPCIGQQKCPQKNRRPPQN